MVEYGRIEDVGGGQIRDDSGGGIPAMPGDAVSVTVAQWPPAGWGPKLYEIDQAGNRVTAARPGTGP